MAQIEKKKKKGRPSKADLAARRATVEDAGVSPSTVEDEAEVRRRSLRRKTFRYNIIDYDEDYLDENDVVSEEDNNEEEEGDENGGGSKRRRGKKVKLVVKLSNGEKSCKRSRRTSHDSVSRRGRVGDSEEEEEEDDDEVEEEREVKKLRINGDGDDDEEEEEENDVVEGREEKEEIKGKDDEDIAGTQNGISSTKQNSNGDGNTPLPDKKQLELVLDKLQKKDTYGVYSEPVDPEELPDYHEVIEHPMDFSTVRKKLANGAYSNLEQFESDVFLISSNAMQYNSPDTVYYRQACAIKELAEKKFERVRMQIERLEKESKSEVICEQKVDLKSEHKEKSYSLIKKQTKKPLNRGMQENIGSDFSTGPTLTMMDAPLLGGVDQVGNFERPVNHGGPLEGTSSFADNVIEKAEDSQLGKGVLPKFGRRTYAIDENRRATYNISNQPEEKPESVFMTFDSDKKQLISVGLSGELSYARSLARYAATLGPMAWRIASKRIEEVLPEGSKYGRGWIGEYEPLPTPVLAFKHVKDPFAPRLGDSIDSRKEDKKDPDVLHRSHDVSRKDEKLLSECHPQANVHIFNQPSSDKKMSAIFGSGSAKQPLSTISDKKNLSSGGFEEGVFKGSEPKIPSIMTQQNSGLFQQQNQFSRDTVCPENMNAKRVEPNSPSISNQKRDCFPPKQHTHNMDTGKIPVKSDSMSTFDQKNESIPEKQPLCVMEIPTCMPNEPLPKGKNFLQSPRVAHPDPNGAQPDMISNVKTTNNFVGSNRVITSSQGFISPHLSGAPISFPPRQDQGLSDPVLVMKMMTEKFQRQQQNGSAQAQAQAQPNNAAQAAANAWMSVGSGIFRPPSQNSVTQNSQTSRSHILTDSLYNVGTRMFYPQAMQEYPGMSGTMNVQPEKMGLFPQPNTKVGNEGQVPSRPMVFPQLGQTPWRGLSPHNQQKQKPDTLPPDLNVAFQSSVDSQQPDLALQL